MKVCSVLEKWGICWLKIINTNSGWVSENYLGFPRIMKWFYSRDIEKKRMSSKSANEVHMECESNILSKNM